MDREVFRRLYEKSGGRVSRDLKRREAYWKAIAKAASPEHSPTPKAVGFYDFIRCVCGSETEAHYNNRWLPWFEWREHVARELGIPKKRE